MSLHFRVLCSKCKAVIAQCRCICCDKDDKTQSYGVCDKCIAMMVFAIIIFGIVIGDALKKRK